MVDDFDSCEFWLPPEFLKDDDDFGFKGEAKREGFDSLSHLCSPTSTDMSSPGESVVSSTESESDEDEYVTGLTRKMAHTTLEDNSIAHEYETKKGLRLSSSPKSPLCNAAGEFARRKMVEESSMMNEFSLPIEKPGPKFGYPTNPPPQLSYQQLQALRHLQFQEFRRRQMINQIQQNTVVKNGERMPMGLPVSAWPPLQRPQPKPQPGTGMRAVFLGANLGGAKKQCAGTGVFLPRTLSSSGNRKNKPACSPVLIPHRVVQTLNLNLETLGVQNEAHHHPGCYNNNEFCAGSGAALKYNNMNKDGVMQQQKQMIAKADPENQEVNRLPPEWIY